MDSQEIKRRILMLNTEQGRIKTPMLNNLLTQFAAEIRYEQKLLYIEKLNKHSGQEIRKIKRIINVS